MGHAGPSRRRTRRLRGHLGGPPGVLRQDLPGVRQVDGQPWVAAAGRRPDYGLRRVHPFADPAGLPRTRGRRGRMPIEHVFGHVSYLRRTAEVLQVSVLHLDLGQRGAYADTTEDRAEVRARIDWLYDRIRDACQTHGYVLVDGSTYQEIG